MSIEKERKAFEAYYIANHHDGDIHPNQQLLEWSEKGEFYFATSVNDLWDMWYASANREGYKLVPVEPTEKMQRYGNRLALADKGYIDMIALQYMKP